MENTPAQPGWDPAAGPIMLPSSLPNPALGQLQAFVNGPQVQASLVSGALLRPGITIVANVGERITGEGEREAASGQPALRESAPQK